MPHPPRKRKDIELQVEARAFTNLYPDPERALSFRLFPRANSLDGLGVMRLYWEVARRAFRRYSTYVGATVAGLFTNTFFRAYTFVALFAAAGRTIGGFDLRDTLTYSFLTQSMIMAVAMWGWWDIAERIRTGDVVTDLFRPCDYQMWWLAQDLGRAAFHVLGRGIGPFLVGALVFDLRLPVNPATWIAVLVSVVLAIVVSFGIRFMANLWMFWVLDYRGPATLLLIVAGMLSGFVVPIAFFPDGIREVVEALPFAAMIQVPIEVFLEKRTGIDLLAAFGFQAAWAVALLLLGRWVLSIATRRVVTQGG
jgi:ABC-2 type transport system permease protein